VWLAYEATRRALDTFQRAADANLAARLRDELGDAVARYDEIKRGTGALDFVDLLLRARNMLVEHAAVRAAFQARFTHILVDEFQDTDPLQAEILLLLAADDPGEHEWKRVTPVPGKLFIVGDPKQAIYRFRRADVETYQDVCRLLAAGGAKRAYLHTSFRSTPDIQRAVNAAFAPLMTGDRETVQAEYVALSGYREDGRHPSVVVLPVPEPYGQRQVAGYAIERSQPAAVGAFIHWLIEESGWSVTERTTPDQPPVWVPVAARHVCVLFRRFTHFEEDVTRPYVDALEARGVPHLLVGGKSFHNRDEVETVRAALAAVEWPDDELMVFATLRGALFAIGDEALLEYRHAHGAFRPYGKLPAPVGPELQPIVEALRLLRTLHGRRNRVPVADTVTALLDATRAHVGLVLRSGGEQALANVLHVAELARQYELDGGLSFRGFVDALREEAENGRAAEAPILEEGSDGVRLMTVHKAKGLEFPVVVLADMTAKLRSERPDRLIDRSANACYLRLGGWTPIELAEGEAREVGRDGAEGVRLAYVAATRARDLLVLPAVGDGEWQGGWTAPLHGAVYPPSARRRTAEAAPGCPEFKADSVLTRPDDDPATPATVCPGLHTMSAPGVEPYSVVWWDPHVIDLGAEPTPGIKRETLILKDVPEAVVNEDLEEYDRWRRSRDEALARGAVPSVVVRTATEWAAGGNRAAAISGRDDREARQVDLFEAEARPPKDPTEGASGEPGVVIVDARGPGSRGGARFGELVHAVLAIVPLDADADSIGEVATVQGRVLSAPDDEIAGAVETVGRVLGHDLLARARQAAARGACRRESPVSCLMPDGTLVEGIVDLAFEESGRWTIVDYKTDREIEASGEERYRRQVGVYLTAITRATGRPADGVLVRI
jgi:ATP-dependent exoDNAse (exonuclease V) beta subunit